MPRARVQKSMVKTHSRQGRRSPHAGGNERFSASYSGLEAASHSASIAARASSKKKDTKPELVLRRELFARGLRYRLHHPGLPGRPDIVFRAQRLVVFCDGDFWHGRDLRVRLAKLKRGHNAEYWQSKITNNVARDRHQTRVLEGAGWIVLRFWESDIQHNVSAIASTIQSTLAALKNRGAV
jgi:DNA mismatch endonuclease (patch repair protein)